MSEAGGRGQGRRILQAKRKKKPVYEFVENGFHVRKPWGSSKLDHFGEVYNIGDIIRVTGVDEETYYGEIQKFWSDAYTEKFITMQWLIPTQDISKDGSKFDPNKYTHGPVHSDLVNVRCIGLVMTAFSFGAPPNSPAFNRTGELAVMLNTNIPSKTSVSVPYFKL